MQEFRRSEDITPDRFFDNMDTLRAAISRQTSPTARAVYQATMAHLLAISAFEGTMITSLKFFAAQDDDTLQSRPYAAA